MDNKEKETNTLVPVSIRLSPEIMSVIDIIVANNGRSNSEILRLLVDKRLLWYVPKIHFVEHDDAEKYHKTLYALYSEMEGIRSELKRIGINYNQEIKLKHIKEQYKSLKNDLDTIAMQAAEEEEIKKDCLPAKDLDAIMNRYEEATKKVGEQLCRILE